MFCCFTHIRPGSPDIQRGKQSLKNMKSTQFLSQALARWAEEQTLNQHFPDNCVVIATASSLGPPWFFSLSAEVHYFSGAVQVPVPLQTL